MYGKIYRNVFYPLYETTLKGRKTLSYFKKLEESQWYPREQLKELQWAKVMALLNHAYNNVPFYKERFDKSKINPQDIRNPEDFRKIPFLTKEDIRNNREALLARNYKDKSPMGVRSQHLTKRTPVPGGRKGGKDDRCRTWDICA